MLALIYRVVVGQCQDEFPQMASHQTARNYQSGWRSEMLKK